MPDLVFTTRWSAQDGEWAGLCPRFPSLAYRATTEDEALAGIQQLVADILEYGRNGSLQAR